MRPAPEGKIRFRIDAPGYESSLVVPIDDAKNLQAQVADWLEMQLRYLQVFGPEEAVTVAKETMP